MEKIIIEDRNWAAFWDDKASQTTDFQATGRSVLDIVSYLYLVRDIALILDLSRTDELLDIGCGTGIISLSLSGFVQHIHGIDISPKMVERAINNCASAANISFAQGTILEPGVSPLSQTKVLAYSVLQYLRDEYAWRKAFEILYGILSPGGMAYYAANADLGRRDAYIQNVLASQKPEKLKQQELENVNAISWVTPRQAVRLATEAGLRAKWRPMNERIWQHFYMYDLVLQKDE